MRFAFLTELYAPSVGGQEMFFAGLARALIARGHAVSVYAIAHATGLPPREVIDGVDVHRYPEAPHYTKPRWKAVKRDWLAIARYAWWTRRIAKRGEYDVLVANQWPLLHAAILPRAARRRTILHWCEVRTSPPLRLAQRLLPSRVAANAAISDAVGDRIAALSNTGPALTLPSGIDLTRAQWRPREERSGIVCLGRLAAHKNVPMLIDAFAALVEQGYAGRLTIAGGGPAADDIQRYVLASTAANRIDLPGFVDDERKFALLAENELLAMPSMREGFPHVVSEAMSTGLPVVTADYPENGTRDIVLRYGCGIVTPPGAEAFVAGLQRALDEWHRYSDAGRHAAAGLDWAIVAERLERMAEERFVPARSS